MIVVNLLAGPGSGKSTTAAGVFALLKLHNINCELVTEYAKDVTYREAFKILKDQIYVFGKQNHRISNLNGVVDVVITDSPILLSLVYCDRDDTALRNLVLDRFNKQENLNYFINRVKPYSRIGRSQLEVQAMTLDVDIQRMLRENDIVHKTLNGDETAINHIAYDIIKRFGLEPRFKIQ